MDPLLPLAYTKSREGEVANTRPAFHPSGLNPKKELETDDLPSDALPTPSTPTTLVTSEPPLDSTQLSSDFQAYVERTSQPLLPSSPVIGQSRSFPNSPNASGSPRRSPLKKRTRRVPQKSEFSAFALDREGKVYGILLEDDKFPIEYSPSLYDDPSFFVVENSSESSARASEEISRTFERDPNREIYSAYMLNLDGFGLKCLPEQIADFRDLVIFNKKKGEFTQPRLQLYASNNQLRSISPKIFEIGGLESLVVRANKIARVPCAIGQAKSLRTINIAQNKIKFFPHTIVQLPNLEILTIRPNRLIEPDSIAGVREIPYREPEEVDPNETLTDEESDLTSYLKPVEGRHRRILRYISPVRWLTSSHKLSGPAVNAIKLSRNLSSLQDSTFFSEDSPSSFNTIQQTYLESNASWMPSLSEMCLRRISEYLISKAEIAKWRETTHERVYRLAIKAMIHRTNGETCGMCDCTVVDAAAEMTEWWDLADCNLVPVKRKFCSKRCAVLWNKAVDEHVSGN